MFRLRRSELKEVDSVAKESLPTESLPSNKIALRLWKKEYDHYTLQKLHKIVKTAYSLDRRIFSLEPIAEAAWMVAIAWSLLFEKVVGYGL